MCLVLVLLLRISGLASFSPAAASTATSEMCHRQRHGREAAGAGGLASADTVFSGTILELFPGHHATSGGHPGVVRVRSVYKGDPGIERFPVVVEGFGSPEFCWKPARKVQKRAKEFGLQTSSSSTIHINLQMSHFLMAKLTFLRKRRRLHSEEEEEEDAIRYRVGGTGFSRTIPAFV